MSTAAGSSNQVGTITATIVEWKYSDIDSTKIIYVIEVEKRGSSTWLLKKRYKEFDDLHRNLKKLYPNLPSLPGKTLFAVKDPLELDKRMQGLNDYLKHVIARPDAYFSDSMIEFLQLDQHAADQILNPPRQIGELTGFVHGVRDFFYDPSEGILFTLCANMNIASRLDAYVTNFRMPWEMDQTQTVLSVGTLECWLQTSKEEFQFQKVWSIPYPLQAICMHWESQSSILSVGLDEGKVGQVIARKDVAYTRYEKILDDFPAHELRVMGIYFDGVRDVLYTCSEDKSIRTIEDSECTNTVRHSETGLTGMVGDKEQKRLFVTNRSGILFIYSIHAVCPELIIAVSTQNLGAIRGLQVDVSKNYVFTGGFDDGEVAVFDLTKPGKVSKQVDGKIVTIFNRTSKEKFTKRTASLMGKKKVRSVSWSGSRAEIYVGTQDGTVSIWDTKKGQPIYVIKAHENEITKVQWIEERGILLTSAKEKFIKFWDLPNEWRDKSIQMNEERENYIAMQTQSMIKVKQNLKRIEIDSDEDDLKGWHKDY